MSEHDDREPPPTWVSPGAEAMLQRRFARFEPEPASEPEPPAAEATADQPITEPVTTGSVVPPPVAEEREPAYTGTTHDWRWVVGGIGRVLISIGLLIFAFVAYQLWGTGIQYARAQDQLEQEFQDQLAAVGTTSSTAAPTTGAPATTEAPAPDTSPGAPATTEAPTTTEVPTTTGAAPTVEVALGDVLGVLEIPSIDVLDYIVAGVRASDLERGVGHYPYTPLPGHTGNVAIAGHRTTHGQPFFKLDKLDPGDEIVVTTVEGRFVYQVTGTRIVDPTDFTVLYGDPSRSELTLTTCHPRYSTKQRLVVSATLVSDGVVDPPADIVYDSSGGSGDGSSDDPAAASTLPGDEETPSTAASGADTTVAQAGPGATDGEPATTAPATTPDATTQDAFSRGWFSDPDAWPQIALWGFALTGFALLMTWLGERTRNWFSALVGILPFVVLLYFWFENVNRLLPPNL